MRPKLLLDIDGVLCPFGFRFPPNGFHQYAFKAGSRTAKVFYSEENQERIQKLAKHFDIVWATHWQDYANEQGERLFGITGLPIILLDYTLGDPEKDELWVIMSEDHPPILPDHIVTLKLPYIDLWYRDNPGPFVWIDDSIEDDVHDWAADKEDILLITPRKEVGLTDELVDTMIEFAERIS